MQPTSFLSCKSLYYLSLRAITVNLKYKLSIKAYICSKLLLMDQKFTRKTAKSLILESLCALSFVHEFRSVEAPLLMVPFKSVT